MTLLEMSVVYAEHAAVIRSRIVELRGLTRQETDPEAVFLSIKRQTLRDGKEGCARETQEGCPAPLKSLVFRTL